MLGGRAPQTPHVPPSAASLSSGGQLALRALPLAASPPLTDGSSLEPSHVVVACVARVVSWSLPPVRPGLAPSTSVTGGRLRPARAASAARSFSPRTAVSCPSWTHTASSFSLSCAQHVPTRRAEFVSLPRKQLSESRVQRTSPRSRGRHSSSPALRAQPQRFSLHRAQWAFSRPARGAPTRPMRRAQLLSHPGRSSLYRARRTSSRLRGKHISPLPSRSVPLGP
jgi:hypothetical protein